MARAAAAVLVGVLVVAAPSGAQTTDTLMLRGRAQTVRLYGPRSGFPVIVSSGDGGWLHLAPHVADTLAAHGFFVVGFDVKAYLSSFTSGAATLGREDEPGDYHRLVQYASAGTVSKPILVGVSEGAGLSILAATDPATRSVIAGVLGLGVPDATELGWRWRDAIIYLTHASPREPMVSTAALAAGVAPAPLAAIHSTRDEFVPLDEVRRVMAAAAEPKRLWVVRASNHRFSDNLEEFDRTLLEAVAWIREHDTR